MPAEDKNSLNIALTESVVFLPGADAAGRRTQDGPDAGAPLRGLLTLTLARPTRISSVDVQLQCRSNTTWPEGLGSRRIDIVEDHTVFEATATFFNAKSDPVVSSRRTVSMGPGTLVDDEGATGPIRSLRDRQSSTDRTRFHRDPVNMTVRGRSPPSPTPPYTPTAEWSSQPTPTHQDVRSVPATPSRVEDDPLQILEYSRNALLADLEREHIEPPLAIRRRSQTPHHTPIASSGSSLQSQNNSRRGSSEDDRMTLHSAPTTTHHSQVNSPSASTFHLEPMSLVTPPSTSRTRTQTPSVDAETRRRGKSSSRFSIASVVGAFRSKSRGEGSLDLTQPSESRGISRGHSATAEVERGRPRQKGTDSLESKEESTISIERAKFSKLFTHDSPGPGHRDPGHGWKEFKKGTYTYPILFTILSSYPASIISTHGSVFWRLRATVHRPGAFSPAIRAEKTVHVVAAPGEADTEESESIVVERAWDNQMQYVLSVSGRAFPIGGHIPLQIVFAPMDKVKIHRIVAYLDEKLEYMTSMTRVVRTDPVRRHPLLNLRKEEGHLLPLESCSAEALAESPLHEVIPNARSQLETLLPEDREVLSETAASLMGPGPWAVETDLPIPTCSTIRPSNRNKSANILITHALRVVIRVERGDDTAIDSKTGKRKLFDIVVHTPIHILSCLCSRDYMVLPLYGVSETQPRALDDGQVCACAPTPPLHGRPRPRRATSANTPETIIAQGAQYERLIAGVEADSGERPPAYVEVIAGRA